MRTRCDRSLPLALVAVVLLSASAACTEAESTEPDPQAPLPGDLSKMDLPLQTQLGASGSLPVAILLRSQMLLGPSAFDAFVAANAGRPRSMLRVEVTNTLKETARSEQAESSWGHLRTRGASGSPTFCS